MNDDHNPVTRRAALLIANTTGTPQEIAAALDSARMLARPPVTVNSGYPISVRATASGCEIDVHLLVKALVRGLAGESTEDPEGVAAELAEIAAATGGELDDLLDTLIDRLGGATIRYTVSTAHQFASKLVRAAGPVFPRQQDRRAG